ncbi:uncharacterized protein LOC119779586 [Cyprinodon tularosa]|uniref:uncharacterized protein LOC119779586 n=1 Tax=Cyprinodon tularosa TaxID=77115 RepID=UPI0018E26501|nr:uncharacterized protein LOC119779586 [Cyprinodon tularosa]
MAGINKVRTTPYHPRGNPVERFNRTLLDMLGTLTDREKCHWKEFVKPLVHAYNCTKNDSTGFSPYELMFGRQPRLPVDLAFGLPLTDDEPESHSQYVQKLKSHLEDSYKLAINNSKKLMERNKLRFDRHITASELAIGDRVLVRNVRLRGKHKLADKWEREIYIVTKKAENLPVYTVRPEGKEKPLRTLHRDLLLPCGYLSATVPKKPENNARKPHPSSPTDSVEDMEDDYDDDLVLHIPVMPEPLKFSTVIEIPPNPQSSRTTELPVNPENTEPATMETEPSTMEPEPSAAEDAVEVVPDHSEVQPDETMPVEASCPEENSPSLEPSSEDLGSDPPEHTEPTFHRPVRKRNPPDRLQYSKPGHQLMKSIQSLFHGLSSMFTVALLEDKEDVVFGSHQPVIECQPSPCPRTYMRKGGESVTHST